MLYLQRYFELTLTLETENFNQLLSKVYDKPNGEYEIYTDNDKYVDDALFSKGIMIFYNDKSYKKKIKLKLDANMIFDSDDPDDDSIKKSLRKLEKRIGEYFNSNYSLDDFKLSKMGIITDIDVRDREKVRAYLKIFHKVGKVKGFSPSSRSRLNNDSSFCLKGNSNQITFLIYDLQKQLREQLIETESKPKKLKSLTDKTEGILRVEIWLTAAKAIRNFTDEIVASEQLAGLLKNDEKIFIEILTRIIPFGDFYKKNKAVEIIQKKVSDRRLRRRMLRLLVLIPEKKSLLLAQKALNYRRIDDVMEMFSEIELSPVTISKRHDFKKLNNIYKYM